MRTLPICIAILTLLSSCAVESQQSVDLPRLVVVISLDQFRADYAERFAPFFGEDGFRRFAEAGAVLKNVRYRHAATMTCPGHAAIATGTSGNTNGIVANDWYDVANHRKVYCAEDTMEALLGHPGQGRSPRNLLSETIGDVLKKKSVDSKVFSIAGKDRSAIMMAGKSADAAYWLQDSVVTSSTYYLDRLPAWVSDFNERRLPQHLHGAVWERVLPVETYDSTQGPDDFWNEEDRHGLGKSFPHKITGGSDNLDWDFYEALRKSPFEDEILLDFVDELIVGEALGQDDVPDVLAIGFSTTDRIGHPYGPDSHEIMDNVIRTDRLLSRLFEVLETRVGLNDVLVVLTADHGVQRLPELVANPDLGIWAGRVSTSTVRSDISDVLDDAFGSAGTSSWIDAFYYPHLYLNRSTLSDHGVTVEQAAAVISEKLDELPRYDRVVGLSQAGESDPERYSLYPGRSGDLLIRLADHHISRNSEFGTTHGTPWEGDRHVPMMWLGRWIKPGVVQDSLNVIDLAPTLAAILNLDAGRSMDGRVISRIIEGSEH